MANIDPIASIKAEAENTPLAPESNPRKAIKVDSSRGGAPYYVHPKAKLIYARKLWMDPDNKRILYGTDGGYAPADPAQTLALSEDTTAYIYESSIDGVLWGEVRGAAVDTFLGMAADAAVLLDRAQSLDLNHLIPDA